jgi:hypothetical protein
VPSQRPIVIPSYAILDHDVCQEFGKPAFAWHPLQGKIAAGGGGLVASLPYGRRASAPSAQVTYEAAGAKIVGIAADCLNFGRAYEVEAVSPGGLSVWAYFRQNTATQFQVIASCLNSSAAHGWELGVDNANKVRFFCSGAATRRFLATNAIGDTRLHTAMGTVLPGNAWGGLYIDGRSETNAGDASPQGPTYATALHIGDRAGGAGTITSRLGLWGVLVWRKQQPARVAQLLDADPALLWWWPGKSRRRYYALGGATTYSQAVSAVVTLAPSVVRQTDKGVSATSTLTGTCVKEVGKPISASVTAAAAIVKSAGKTLSAASTMTATCVKDVGKVVSAGVTALASMLAQRAFLVTLAATVALVGAMTRSVGKVVSAPSTASATCVREIAKAVTAGVTVTAGITKSITMTLTATAVGITATLAATFTGASTALRSRVIGKVVRRVIGRVVRRVRGEGER